MIENNQIVVLSEFGSSLYGTRVEGSDTDYKGVFVPKPRDLVLQRAPRHAGWSTKSGSDSKNGADDIDHELWAIHEYAKLLIEGQTGALDLLFAPAKHFKAVSPEWIRIVHAREIFLHKGISAYIGYARTQAAKYGIKGSRIAAVRQTLDALSSVHSMDRLGNHCDAFAPLLGQSDLIALVELDNKRGHIEQYLQVCNRKFGFSNKVGHVVGILARIFEEYGERARLAEKNEGIDWKALMHAVRVAHEAVELLRTKHITFPRPEAELLLKIRRGALPYQQVADLIENGLTAVEDAQAISRLPAEPDHQAIDDLVLSIYGADIRRATTF